MNYIEYIPTIIPFDWKIGDPIFYNCELEYDKIINKNQREIEHMNSLHQDLWFCESPDKKFVIDVSFYNGFYRCRIIVPHLDEPEYFDWQVPLEDVMFKQTLSVLEWIENWITKIKRITNLYNSQFKPL